MGLSLPSPVLAQDLFAPDRAALLDLLEELSAQEWERPTACTGWTVRDVAAHLLGGDLGNLSRRRDGFFGTRPPPGVPIVEFVNQINDDWMRAARRLSPRVVVELLRAVGPPLFACFAGLDQFATGGPVSWAGPGPAPVWLDVAREYTERWHHQQHVRDAVGRPGRTERRFLHPVLATFAHALPVAFREVAAPEGATVQLRISGEAGGDWTVRRESDRWRLYAGAPPAPDARVTLDAATAWRLFTKGVTPDAARPAATSEGDPRLADRVFYTVAIIA